MSKLAILGSNSERGKAAQTELREIYGHTEPEDADVIVALGGDGFLLHCLHEYSGLGKPFFGMNRGTLGFLMNTFRDDNLQERVSSARERVLFGLRADVEQTTGDKFQFYAFNEVALTRHEAQSANLSITVDGVERIAKFVGDGVLVSTCQGSTAYNRSAHGPVLPLSVNALALTPISGFLPRSWRGAVLDGNAVVSIRNLDPVKRPLYVTADYRGAADILSVTVQQDSEHPVTLLFDHDHSMEERILREQFSD